MEQVESGAPSLLSDLVDGNLGAITAQTVYEAAKRGDALALDVVKSTAHYLGAGLASLINILNPDVVVLVGGVTNAGERLFEPLRYEITRRAFRPAVQACSIVPGELGGLAGVYGAAKVFLDRTATEID